MSVYGKFQIHIGSDQTDRIGLRTLQLYQHWQASRGDMSLAELDEEEPAPPEVPGGLFFIGRKRVRVGGVFRTSWEFEGVNGNGKDVTFKVRGTSPDFGFEPGFAQLPIQQHPKIEHLLDTYNGQPIDAEIFWPLRIASNASGGAGVGLGGSGSGKEIVNPMFGRDSYFGFQGGTYWYRYVARSESEIPDIIGKLFSGGALPGNAPRHGNRNWLCAGTPHLRRGPVVEVTELYWLSEEGGWPKAIYGSGLGGSTTGSTGIEGAGRGLTPG
jgi:hypothetical protein